MRWLLLAVIGMAGMAFAGEPTTKPNAVDPEVYRAAMEKLNAKDAARKEKNRAEAEAEKAIPRTVFVCDSSGSMMNGFDLIRLELHLRINDLKPDQSFGIVFFLNDELVSLEKKLVRSTPEVKPQSPLFH